MNETPAEAAAILTEGSESLDALFSRLSRDAAEARGTIGSGAWSARDLAGHIETWEEVALRTIEDIRAGRPPDIRNTVEDSVAEGDRVVVRWTGNGTHTGAPLMGVPAMGAPVTAQGVYVFRIVDGKIAEVWDNWDNLNVVQQLGGLPTRS